LINIFDRIFWQIVYNNTFFKKGLKKIIYNFSIIIYKNKKKNKKNTIKNFLKKKKIIKEKLLIKIYDGSQIPILDNKKEDIEELFE
jgi:hypothetical protein